MKKIVKTNSQIRKEKESLIIENFKSVMGKLDENFVSEDKDNKSTEK